MRRFDRIGVATLAGAGLLAGGLVVAIAADTGAARAETPISYARDVQPMLDAHCVECHRPGGKGFEANGLDLRSYQGVIKGSKLGPVVVPGDVFTSNLLRAVLGQVNAAVRMPFHQAELPEADSTRLLRWVYQGARDN